jgi:dipeptidyl aminopeptidase/acylaminoacyl peptidase
MIRLLGAVCAATLALASSTFLSAFAIAAPPVGAFGSLPTISRAKLSPDGKHLAVIGPSNGRDAVTVFTLDAPTVKPMRAGFPDADAVGIRWANDNRLICTFKANVKRVGVDFIDQFVRAISVAMDGGKAVALMHDTPLFHNLVGAADTNTANIVGQGDPDHVYMVAYISASQMEAGKSTVNPFQSNLGGAQQRFLNDVYYLSLFKVDVTSGDTEMVFHGSPQTIELVTDGHGHLIGQIDQSPDDLKNHYIVGARELTTFDANGGDYLDIAGIAYDGSSLAATSFGSSDTRGLYAYKFGDANLGAALFSDPNHDLIDYTIDDWTGRLGSVSWADDKVEYRYFDPAVEHIKQRIERALPGQSIAILSRDQASANYVVSAESSKNPTTYYIFNVAGGQLSIVGSAYPALSAADLGEQRPYVYKSKDGTEIHGYLTLPPGKAPKNLPVVVFPHGGPEARDTLGFDWWAQFMASRGYAVLQPNFRGSSGYGRNFRDAGDGQWTGKVLEDINGGLEQLVNDGIADPKRACIVGASYGGYAALAAATFTPEHYACAVSYAGVSDLSLDLNRTARNTGDHSQALSIWEKRMGAGRFDGSKLASMSPAAHADQVRAPILLIHSDKDITVDIEQSEREQSALQSAGKSVQFVKLAGEDHYLLQSATRIQMLKALEPFLAAHIGN